MNRGRDRLRSLGASVLVKGVVALLLTWAVPSAAGAQQLPTSSLVFDDVTVVDVEQGKLLPARRVVVVGNRIRDVGKMGAVKVPKGAQVIKARGKYLIPGLWDMHVHPMHAATDFFYPLFIANGITGIRDAWSEVPLDTLIQWRQEIVAGTRVGPPRQLLAGHAFGQQYPTDDSVEVAAILDSIHSHGANFIKVYPLSFPLAAAVRRAGLPFGGHLNRGASAIEASDSGMRIIDHVNAAGDLPAQCLGETASVEQCRLVAERFRRNGTWWVPTLIVREDTLWFIKTMPAAARVHARLRKHNKSFLAGLPVHGNWLRDSVAVGALHTSLPDSAAEPLGYLSLVRRAGLPMLVGTDGVDWNTRPPPPGAALHAELAIYVAEGLTPLDALQSATLNPAKLLRATDSLGTVAPGKLADLVLLDADPLADITNTTMIRAVIANGRYFDRAALDQLRVEARATGKGKSYGDP